MYYQRTLTKTVEQASKSFKVVLVTGPRQVGKTTLLEQIKERERVYVTLDDVQANALAQTDPALFFQTYRPPILIDEVQKAPQLFPYIKILADKSDKRGQFWLTGSQQFHLMKNISESLAGRVAVLDLQGLSQAEKQGEVEREPFLPALPLQTQRPIWDMHQIFDMIVKGSFPQLYENPDMDTNLFYSSYIRTYLERDIRDIIRIIDENSFITFLKVLASRTGQELNYNSIAQDIGKTVNTIKSWTSILETSGLIYLLQPYTRNIGKRSIKTPKMYFLDTGLCCYLCGIPTGELLRNMPISGALFETYVVSEILKSYWHNGKRPFTYFYRDTSQKEIDLLIEENGKLYPIEIKQSANPQIQMTKSFSIIDEQQRDVGAIICMIDKLIPMNKEVYAIPASYI